MKAPTPLLLLPFLLCLYACQPTPQSKFPGKAEMLAAQTKSNQALMEVQLQELVRKEQALNEIEDSLASLLKVSQHRLENFGADSALITSTNKRLLAKQRDAVMADVQQLQGQNHWLSSQLSNSRRISGSLQQRIDSLQGQIHMRDLHIKKLSRELTAANDRIERILKVQRKKERIRQIATLENKPALRKREDLLAQWQKAFYTIGGPKELKMLLSSEGENPNSLRLKENYLENFPRDKNLHYTRNTSILCRNNILKILPEPSQDSYQIEGKKLTITEPETFWSMPERALVIVTD